jgi:hypothetical protein
LPIKAKLILDHVRIAESILILLIYQKEEVARTDEKANSEKALLTRNVSSLQKEKNVSSLQKEKQFKYYSI